MGISTQLMEYFAGKGYQGGDRLSMNRNLDVAVAQPLYFDRLAGIGA
jgi:hypothetical protein